MKKLLLAIAALFLFAGVTFAQSLEELQAERQQLKTEMASKDYQKMEKQYAKLGSKPESTKINSVDGVFNASSSILTTLDSSEKILTTLKDDINASQDGSININNYLGTIQEFEAQIKALGTASNEAKEALEQIKSAKNDVKGLSPLEAKSATKALNWSKSALDISATKIDMNVRLLNNIIKSCKAAK